MHCKQQILTSKYFGKVQMVVIWGSDSEYFQQVLPQIEKEMGIRVQRLSDEARIPIRGSKLAAGYDFYSLEDTCILANDQNLVKIGLAIAVPEETYTRLAPRSGLATKGISVDTGVVDSNFRGEVKVLLINHGTTGTRLGKEIA